MRIVVPDPARIDTAGASRRRILVAVRLADLPQIDEAFANAELPWSKVRRIVTVATCETEAEWPEVAMRGKQRAERGFPEDVTPVDLILEMAQTILSSEPDGSMPGQWAVDGSIYEVIVDEAAVSDGVTPNGMRKTVFNRDT